MVSLDTKIAMSIYINYVNGYPSIITYLYTLTPSNNVLMSYKLFVLSGGCHFLSDYWSKVKIVV